MSLLQKLYSAKVARSGTLTLIQPRPPSSNQ